MITRRQAHIAARLYRSATPNIACRKANIANDCATNYEKSTAICRRGFVHYENVGKRADNICPYDKKREIAVNENAFGEILC